MKVIGITSGVGSLLIGARQAGFDVVGNIEWRKYYNKTDAQGRTTFTENFPGAFLAKNIGQLTPEQLEMATGCDLAMGHPECGNFSTLNGSNKSAKSALLDPGDIPLFVDMIAQLKPKFFVMDDLPKSFIAFAMKEYADRLPEYDLFPEWISNHGYGNIQKHRKRFFMIGALKSQKFAFVPGEYEHEKTVQDIIGDLLENVGQVPNHDPHELHTASGRFINMPKNGDRHTWGEFRGVIKDYPEGKNFEYQHADGSTKVRIGSCKVKWLGPSPVLHGGNPILHPITCLPLTIRERARIQGFPDDFIFYGTKFNEAGEWNHERNLHMVKQTGKAMPIQFARYVAELVMANLKGEMLVVSGKRNLKPNPYIEEAKAWFCKNVGYANQTEVCKACQSAGVCKGLDFMKQKEMEIDGTN